MKRVIAGEEKQNIAASWLDRHERSPSMIVGGRSPNGERKDSVD